MLTGVLSRQIEGMSTDRPALLQRIIIFQKDNIAKAGIENLEDGSG